MHLVLSIVPALGLMTGCGEADSNAAGVLVRDSAGIVIVENPHRRYRSTALIVADTPLVVVGIAQGAEAYELHGITDGLRMTDGRIVIANGGSYELRFYTGAGQHLQSVGGRGSGPGEFQDIGWICRYDGDSLLVYDAVNLRLSVLDSSGSFIRSFGFGRIDGARASSPKQCLSDGSMLVPFALPMAEVPSSTPVSSQTKYMLFTADGSIVDTVGTFDTAQHFVQTVPQQFGGTAFWNLAFGRKAVVSLDDTHFYYGHGASFEVRVYSRGGALHRIIRRSHEPRLVTSGDIARFTQRSVAGVPPMFRGVAQRAADHMPFPSTMPAFSGFELDNTGRLWVQTYFALGDSVSHWTMFDHGGAVAGELILKGNLRVLEIGLDEVLVLAVDELDVQKVLLFQVEPSH